MSTTTLTPPEITSTPEQKLELLRVAALKFAEQREELSNIGGEIAFRASDIRSIEDSETRQLAASLMQEAARFNKDVERFVDRPKSIAGSLHKSFCAVENDLKDIGGSVRRRLEPLALKFDYELDRERRVEELRLAEIAQKEAEDEALAEAERLQAEGHADAAEAILSAPVIPAPSLATQYAPVKTKGESKSGTWTVEVTDIVALAKAVIDGTVPQTAITADLSVLKKMASASQQFYKVPGTVAKFMPGLRVRA